MSSCSAVIATFALSLVACASTSAPDADDPEWELTNAPDNPFPCLNPTPANDWPTGFLRCDNGLVFRPVAATCPATIMETADECLRDADCDNGGYCYCGNEALFISNSCFSSREGECQSDQDCPSGFHCAAGYAGESDATFLYLRCQKPLDECARDEDCPGYERNTSGTGPACQVGVEHRRCCTFDNGCLEP